MQISEYIMMINGCDEVFRVYAFNEKQAEKTLRSCCTYNSGTTNKDYEDYWKRIVEQIDDGNYSIIHNQDFQGVRRV